MPVKKKKEEEDVNGKRDCIHKFNNYWNTYQTIQKINDRLSREGYEIQTTRRVLSFRLTREGQERFTCAKTLGADYTPEALKERIDFTLDSLSRFWYGSVRKGTHILCQTGGMGNSPTSRKGYSFPVLAKKQKERKFLITKENPWKNIIFIFSVLKSVREVVYYY